MEAAGFINQCLAALPAEAKAYQVGQWSGRLLAVALTTAGLLKCYAIARRPGTNTKCVVSLMLVLGALLVSSLLSAVGLLVESDTASELLRLANAVCALALLLAAVVIAILGLLECQDRRGAYKQGTAQAMWALGSAGLLVTLALTASMGSIPNPMDLLGRPSPSGPPGQPLTFDDYNFRFRSPGTPWTGGETNAMEQRAQLAFSRSSPEMSLTVTADKFGQGFSTEQLAEAGKGRLKSRFASGKVLEEKQLTLGGLSGLEVTTRASSATRDVLSVQWYCFTNGFGYQLVSEGPWRHRQYVAKEVAQLFSLFECIDPSRKTDESGARFTTNYTSTTYGYRVEVANTDWRRWRALQREFAWFDFAARREAGYYLAVVPVWLGEEVEENALRGAMLTTMGISYPDQALSDRKSLNINGLSGIQFDYERYVYDVPYHYRLRILQGGGFAYLVCAWTERHKRDFDTVLEEALGYVKIEPSSATPPDPEKLPKPEKATRALVLNQAGAYFYEEKRYARARELFTGAFTADPQPLYFENTLMAWTRLDEPAKALEFIDRQAGAPWGGPKLRALQAHFQARAGKTNDAIASYSKLFSEGFKEIEPFADYVRLLCSAKRYDEALTVLGRELKSEDTLGLRLLEASVHREKGDYAEAIRLLKIQREKAPFVPEVGHALVFAYLDAKEYEAARAVCEDLLKTSEPTPELYCLRGRSEMGLSRLEDAKASFEQALRLAPGDVDIKQSLEVLSGMLGEGSNTLVKEPIAPVGIPAMLLSAPLKAAPEGYGKEYGAYYSRRITAIRFDREAGCKKTDYGRVHILDSAGAAAFGTVEIPFDPLQEEIYVNSLRVQDSSGMVVTGRVSRFYVTDDLGSELVTHNKKLNIPVSGLSPGSVLEFMVTRRDLVKPNEVPFQTFTFSRGIPVRQSIVYLTGDTEGLKFKTSQPIPARQVAEGRYWLCENPIVIRPEPLHPPPDEFLPTLWMGDAFSQWPALAGKYLASIADRLTLDASLREQVRQLTNGLPSEEAKIAVLARQVQTNYAYKGLEFGSRGRIPEKLSEMAQNKYGDCKDHSAMLQQMLGAAGIPACLALVNSSAAVQEDLPSLEQFDHMIVFVPGRGRDAFIDCTQKGALLAKGPPDGLAGKRALVLDPVNPRFETIPELTGTASRLESTRTVRVLSGGDVTVEEELTVTGIQASGMREELMRLPSAARRLFLQKHLKEGQAELDTWGIEALENPAAPLRFKLAYKLRKQFHLVEGRLLGTVPSLLEHFYLDFEQVDNRVTPFQLKYPLEFISKVTVTGPAGWRPQPPLGGDQPLESPFLAARGREEVSGSELRLSFSCREKSGTFPAGDYAAFREAISGALALVERRVGFEERK